MQGGSESRGTTKNLLKQGTNQAEAKIGARSEKKLWKNSGFTMLSTH